MTAPTAPPAPVLNAITVDVEEHFQVSGFESVVDRESWPSRESRVERNTGHLLDLFDASGVRATFFVLGWVAERRPHLVRAIAERGHEIASHGYSHRLAYEQSPEEFRREAGLARRILEDASGSRVVGYRAASFSIVRRNLWALDVLLDAGYEWDSSVFPVVHDRYGVPGAPRTVYRARTPSGRVVLEIPPSTVSLGGAALPVGGGGYLRIYPLALTLWAIARLNRREGIPAVVYVHPWEVDPEQPRVAAPLASRLRHYWGLGGTARKLATLFRRFPFGTMNDVIARATDVPVVAIG